MSALLKTYRKDAFRDGAFVDETGALKVFRPGTAQQVADELNRAIGDGVRVPVIEADMHPLDLHEGTPGIERDPRFRGFVDLAALQGGWLKTDIHAIGELPDKAVSAWIVPEVTANGKTYGPFIRHLLLTDDPAIKDQAPFALLRGPKADDRGPRCSILCFRSSTLTQEETMSDTPAAKLRQKLGLTADATDEAVLDALEKKIVAGSSSATQSALLTTFRTKLGVAADAKDDEVVAKLDAAITAATKTVTTTKEPEIPAAILQAQREVEHGRIELGRERFHAEVDALAAGHAMKITPAMATKLKDRFPTKPATAGALLSAAKPVEERELHHFVIDLLNDLPAHNVTAPGATLRTVPNPLAGDDASRKAELEKNKQLREERERGRRKAS